MNSLTNCLQQFPPLLNMNRLTLRFQLSHVPVFRHCELFQSWFELRSDFFTILGFSPTAVNRSLNVKRDCLSY